jgi:hypothetical protein
MIYGTATWGVRGASGCVAAEGDAAARIGVADLTGGARDASAFVAVRGYGDGADKQKHGDGGEGSARKEASHYGAVHGIAP